MDIQKIVAELRGEMERIGHAIGLLEGNTPTKRRVGRPPKSSTESSRAPRKGGLTPTGRRKLSQTMKMRWAQRRGTATASGNSANVVAATKPKKRGGITPASRKRLAEAMRKRWAEKKQKAKS
jgi:hypothetical protein